jgi:hypothetical protein
VLKGQPNHYEDHLEGKIATALLLLDPPLSASDGEGSRVRCRGLFPLRLERGLEELGKRRKEFAAGKSPSRAERAGASESLDRVRCRKHS